MRFDPMSYSIPTGLPERVIRQFQQGRKKRTLARHLDQAHCHQGEFHRLDYVRWVEVNVWQQPEDWEGSPQTIGSVRSICRERAQPRQEQPTRIPTLFFVTLRTWQPKLAAARDGNASHPAVRHAGRPGLCSSCHCRVNRSQAVPGSSSRRDKTSDNDQNPVEVGPGRRHPHY